MSNGKPVAYTAEKVAHIATQHGLVQTWHVADDIGVDLVSGELKPKYGNVLGRAAAKVTYSKPMRALSKAAEYEGAVTRISHMIGLLNDTKFTSKFANETQLMNALVTRVRAVHPDPTMLTNFEAKYLRRIIPFYTFQRAIVPQVMFGMLKNPKGTLAPMQFYHAMNEVEGNDPKSLGYEWNQQRALPTFMSGMLSGGVMPSFGVENSRGFAGDIGSPLESVAGTGLLGGGTNPVSNIVGNVANMVSPLLKAPIEFAKGQRVSDIIEGTGAKINDWSEYTDQMIPFVNQGRAASISPTGSIMGMEIDPLRAVAKGNQANLYNENMLNFLLGLRLSNPDRQDFGRVAFAQNRAGG
jgi:hypothetical protein